MKNILLKIEEHVNTAVSAIGIPQDKFDTLITTTGWIILVYVVLRNINKNQRTEV